MIPLVANTDWARRIHGHTDSDDSPCELCDSFGRALTESRSTGYRSAKSQTCAEVTRILREHGIDEQEREHLRAHAATSGRYVQAFERVLRLIEEREGG